LSVKNAAPPRRRPRARTLIRAGLCLALGAQLCLACLGCGAAQGQAAFRPPPGAHEIAAVPFYPDASHQCGPASLAAVMAFHGKKMNPREVARAVYRPQLQGSLSLDLVLFARAQGLCALWYQGGPSDLVKWINKDLPLVVMVDNGLGPLKKLHYLVVTGHSAQGVLVNSGLSQGMAMPWQDFLPAWRRTGLATLRVASPGPGGCS